MKIVMAAILFGSFTSALAQTASVNLQRVLQQSQEGRTASARLESVWRPRLAALDKEVSDLKADDATFAQESKRRRGWHFWRHVMSKKGKTAKAAALAARHKAIERHREDLQVEFDAQRIRILNEIGKKMTAVAQSYANDHGLSLEYFDPEKRDHVWAPDITPAVVQLYDQTYPVAR
jgi:Skp family chaperone for outer membrane proteins